MHTFNRAASQERRGSSEPGLFAHWSASPHFVAGRWPHGASSRAPFLSDVFQSHISHFGSLALPNRFKGHLSFSYKKSLLGRGTMLNTRACMGRMAVLSRSGVPSTNLACPPSIGSAGLQTEVQQRWLSFSLCHCHLSSGL